jgi:hypothetical protein
VSYDRKRLDDDTLVRLARNIRHSTGGGFAGDKGDLCMVIGTSTGGQPRTSAVRVRHLKSGDTTSVWNRDLVSP